MRLTIQYGVNSVTRDYPVGTNIGSLKHDEVLQAVLGHGDNCRARVNGVEMCDDVALADGQTVVLETAANTKGN